MDIEPILTGELRAPEAYVLRPRGGNALTRLAAAVRPPRVRLACLAFVIRHPDEGVVLVDTGFHADAARSVRGDFGLPMGLLFAGLKPAPEPFDAQLRALGVEPQEVRRVVMTHLHVDHTSGMRLLPNAEFTCAREEWTAAT